MMLVKTIFALANAACCTSSMAVEQFAFRVPGADQSRSAGLPAQPVVATSRKVKPKVVCDPTGFIPLIDMGAKKYKGLDGGLYGGGRIQPPKAHRALAQKALQRIRPLDAKGKPAGKGKVVLISIGMSNTTMEFGAFKALADKHVAKAKHVVIVDTAQGGCTAKAWANSLRGNTKRSRVPFKSKPGVTHTVWDEADRRIRGAGVTPAQVQVVWIKVASSVKLGFPKHVLEFQGNLATIVRLAKKRYPNLQFAYLSSRIYAGYATTMLNPEPWSYESAFGVRGLILQQIKGEPSLNAVVAKGPVKAPVLLWGPYLWADGKQPRSDGLIWERKDLARDGTHPTRSGRNKVAKLLIEFVTKNPLARSWFTGKPEKRKAAGPMK